MAEPSMKEEKDKLDAFDRVKLARHPDRPYALDLFTGIFEDFVEIHGDRRYADDAALVCGFARIGDREVAVIGQQKGRDTNQRRFRNFGMPKPEGYRKALRLMKLAEKFGRPLLTFVDTPGAYPGIDAEERGQAEAIAYNLKEMSRLKVPTIVVVLGEGGSGGALAIGIGDRVLMMENSIYSVISPEGCAAILWKDAAESERAAKSLKLTASDLAKLDVIDGIIEEAEEWYASSDEDEEDETDLVSENLRRVLIRNLDELESMSIESRLEARRQKFRNMGKWVTSES
ncbi:MAG: acetyl-CoA carboxylase carboxyltransferase subunit alpha [Pyrinomonadaceae bacterium]|nr:acetyl-CoA carboxylase carboxyltransferase subunit alpha [Pyrinomonadaceae bacterium]